jgi:two-component system chemotaxis sensor kinase CheA
MVKDPYRYFRIEAREILDVLSQGILRLEARPDGAPANADVERLLRASHTLKGAAGVVGHETIASLAHRLEGLVATYGGREPGTKPEPISTLLGVVDAIVSELTSLGAPVAPAPGPPTAQVEQPESVRLDLLEVDGVLASIADVSGRLASARVSASVDLARTELEARKVAEWLRAARHGSGPTALEWDDVIETVERLRRDLRADREALAFAIEGAERRAREALEDARRLRLLPAETLFTELARAARDAAVAEGRRVELESTGGDVRLDAHVLGLLRDALLQLVRNAIAHALEPEVERRRAGKPEVGRIALRFELRGARALVTCRDDGRGIDVAAVRRALIERGLTSEQDATSMDVEALVRAAMRRGVTTRASATELAGRGVGLQVVGSVIERLRGELSVRSDAGRGTVFVLDVPVSMTASPALVVETGDVTATIPLDAVTRTARIAANDIACYPEGDTLSDGQEAVHFAALARVLRVANDTSARRDVWTTVLLEAGGMRAAIGVDRVLGVANEVVLPLPPPTVADALVVGASLDGRGNPRLALDPRSLVENVQRLPGAPRTPALPTKRAILVIDDSLTSRMLERSILEAAGYEVTTAISGEEALELARRHRFALFVVDVEMPGMSGFDFVAQTRGDPALAGTPAVLVTSRAAAEDRRRGLEAGARGYIVKGEFAQDAFLDTVRRLVG